MIKMYDFSVTWQLNLNVLTFRDVFQRISELRRISVIPALAYCELAVILGRVSRNQDFAFAGRRFDSLVTPLISWLRDLTAACKLKEVGS